MPGSGARRERCVMPRELAQCLLRLMATTRRRGGSVRHHNKIVLAAIGLLAVLALLIVWPHDPAKYFGGLPLPGNPGIHLTAGNWQFDRDGFRLGLDLQGGTHLVLQADMSGVPERERDDKIKGVVNIIERRVNATGVAEPIVQAAGQDRVLVELAGIRDIEEAKNLIGKTARLDFREQVPVAPGGAEAGIPGNTGAAASSTSMDWVIVKARG